MKELLEKQADLGVDSEDDQKGGNQSKAFADDDEEEITTTRRRRLVKKTRQEVVSEPDIEETKPVEGERATGGRRLRRVSVKKQVVMTSDDESDAGDHVEITKKQNEDNEFSYGNDEPKTRKKTAKNNIKKSRKLTSVKEGKAKKGEDNEVMYGGKSEGEEDEEELNMTPASSQNHSEDEGDEPTPAKPTRKGRAAKKTAAVPKR